MWFQPKEVNKCGKYSDSPMEFILDGISEHDWHACSKIGKIPICDRSQSNQNIGVKSESQGP